PALSLPGTNTLLISDYNVGSGPSGAAFFADVTFTPAAPGATAHLFYNDSLFDGNDPGINAADDNAIAPDKTALLPGQAATFANYTSYTKGINGVMVDLPNLPATP